MNRELREESIRWVESTIREQLPAERWPRQAAEALVDAAEAVGTPIEDVVYWIYLESGHAEITPHALVAQEGALR